MIDPIREQQLSELEVEEVCEQILKNARNELYFHMRFLDISLSCLSFQIDFYAKGLGTDGFSIFYQPQYIGKLYKNGRVFVNRAYLHMVFHCLFCHLDKRGKRAKDYWNVACDIAVESMIDEWLIKCIYHASSMYRREIYRKLRLNLKVLTAEGIYQRLQEMNLTKEEYLQLKNEFEVDDHGHWEHEDSLQKSRQRQKEWDDNREKMQTNMETFSNEVSDDSKSLLEQIKIENRERYDYKQFLKKFSVLKEEIEIDPDSFDFIFYTYGLSLYGNMPLIEPLESREVYKIEDFVIVVDTSMSCSGELIKRFLEETYDILSEGESYFRKINIHIIQCDEKIQQDTVITKQEEMKEYMDNFTIIGQGGTDFRPPFEYVNQLLKQGKFKKLRGLIYFTDGYGIYPVKKPIYDTAFVFLEGQYFDLSVPPWAIKLILTETDLKEKK